MVGKALFLFIVMASLVDVDCLMCYNCGYMELLNGTKIKLNEQFEDVPFCDDFTTNKENTKIAALVRCAYLFEVEILFNTIFLQEHCIL